jgi:hypothetical protein
MKRKGASPAKKKTRMNLDDVKEWVFDSKEYTAQEVSTLSRVLGESSYVVGQLDSTDMVYLPLSLPLYPLFISLLTFFLPVLKQRPDRQVSVLAKCRVYHSCHD